MKRLVHPTPYSLFKSQGNQQYRGKPSYNKGYSNNPRGCGKRGPLTGSDMERISNYDRKLNRAGPNGEVSRCLVCDSRFHWAWDCPHSYGNNNDDDDKPQAVHLSLFMGFAKDKSTKLQSLVCQSKCGAVLDTGCATTVCGEQWLQSYVSTSSDFERAQIKEEDSSSTFTFGDGNTQSSVKRMILPCWIGKLNATIMTDVVNCNIPLLLSSNALSQRGILVPIQSK